MVNNAPHCLAVSGGHGDLIISLLAELRLASQPKARKERRLPAAALAKEGCRRMNYVCVLQSVGHPGRFYTGLCKDVAARLDSHNAGQSPRSQIQTVATPAFPFFPAPRSSSRIRTLSKKRLGPCVRKQTAPLNSRYSEPVIFRR